MVTNGVKNFGALNMQSKAAKTSKEGLDVRVVLRKGTSRLVTDTFEGARNTLEEFLAKAGITTGTFVLNSIKAVVGSSENRLRRIRMTQVEDGHEYVHMVIQPGSNTTAWKYRVRIPRDFDVDRLRIALAGDGGSPAAGANPDVPEQDEPPELDIEQFLKDYDTIALSFAPLFPKRDSAPLTRDLSQLLEREFGWDAKEADGAVHLLCTWHQLKRSGSGRGERVSVSEGDLFDKLRILGMLAEEPAEEETRATMSTVGQQLAAALESQQQATAPDASSVHVLRPVAQQDQASPGSDADKMALLRMKASAYGQAQESLLQTAPALSALQARLETAQAEVRKIEESILELQASRAGHQSIIDNPEYASAARKIAKINKIIDEIE